MSSSPGLFCQPNLWVTVCVHNGVLLRDGEQHDRTLTAVYFDMLSSKPCVFAEHGFLTVSVGQ